MVHQHTHGVVRGVRHQEGQIYQVVWVRHRVKMVEEHGQVLGSVSQRDTEQYPVVALPPVGQPCVVIQVIELHAGNTSKIRDVVRREPHREHAG